MTGTVFVALLAGHWVGDHWTQTDHQATHKGLPGWAGRGACAAHVATLFLCQMVALALVAVAEGGFPALQAALGLSIGAISHYWADRRRTLEGLAHLLQRNGKHDYYVRGGSAPLDQAFHMAWLLPTALIITAPTLFDAALLTTISVAALLGLDQLSRLGWLEARRHKNVLER